MKEICLCPYFKWLNLKANPNGLSKQHTVMKKQGEIWS